MAKEKPDAQNPPAPEAAADAPPKKRGKLIPILMLVGIMGVEGVGVFFLTKMLSGSEPATAEGAEVAEGEGGEKPAAEGADGGDPTKVVPATPIEVDLAECRPSNRGTGKLVTIKLRVSALITGVDAEKAKEIVTTNKARINDRVNIVIRSATPQELNEPGLETIKRRLKQEMARVLGDEKLIQEILIPEMMQSGSGL